VAWEGVGEDTGIIPSTCLLEIFPNASSRKILWLELGLVRMGFNCKKSNIKRNGSNRAYVNLCETVEDNTFEWGWPISRD
jgi:hypothetical protein